MKFQVLQKHLLKSPVILAVKNEESLQKALTSDCKIIFLLFGNICTIEEYTKLAKKHGKYVFVHLDLVDGISSREIAIDFIHQYTEADGVISTKPRLLKYAKKYNFITVLRIFMLDSMALENSYHNIDYSNPDMIEILPGIATKAFALIKEYCSIPIIAGGLIRTKKDILQALTDGATAISSSRFELDEVNEIMHDLLANQA
ncbi:MAG TPA: glycerol-3-phosphate responsive antiterminator [Clostridiaceae bacterium]|nr:glycerol-3-phosphate responsive antiterminator [Clostridiaceae bacterium]